jgi:hypothetical protein
MGRCNFLVYLLEVEVLFDLLEDIADHHLCAFAYPFVVVVFEEFVP